jgi:hypothetical protein
MKMIKLTLNTAAFLVAGSASALASSQTWNITEVAESVSGAQGQWHLTVEGGKISGEASMQTHTGGTLTYAIEGSINGPEFTLKMSNRSDGKNGCVATGRDTLNEDQTSHRVLGQAKCDGGFKFYVSGGYQQR